GDADRSDAGTEERGATGEMKARHYRLLERLLSTMPYVPFQPGVTFPGTEGIRGFLDDYEGLLAEEMRRIGNAAESVVRLCWDVDEPVAHLATKHDELAELCEAAGRGADPAEVARKVSQRYDESLDYERRNHCEVLYRRLEEDCREMRTLEGSGDDEELARLRCLVGRDDFRTFERELYNIADDLGEATVFDVTEPEPPLSFLDDRLVF
ncbi:MAG: GvpL/GvpF family gas vesicle protein, partial [Bradymonadaceae bacterium]